MNQNLKDALTSEARALGFDCVGITGPDVLSDAGKHFRDFLAAGAHGDMDWLADSPPRRTRPAPAVGQRALDRQPGRQLRARRKSACDSGPTDPRRDLGLCARRRLSRSL